MNTYGDTFTPQTPEAFEAAVPEALETPAILFADEPAAAETDSGDAPAAPPRPRTEAQILASRLNGAKSRGPVTAEGKFISSRNNFRHGMLAKAIIMKGESLDLFCDFVCSLEEAFQPQGAVENALIEKMAISQWRQMRLMSLERSGIHFKIAQREQTQPGGEQASPSGLIPLDPSTTAFLAVSDLTGSGRSLEFINRWEARCERIYDSACTRLFQLQKARGKKNS